MASFASLLARQLEHRCIVVLDAFFAVGPSFRVAQELLDAGGNRMLHSVMNIYGQSKTLSFLCLDLLWKPIKGKMRFVLVMDGTERFILMCSNLNLDPLDIIKAYSYRFKMEVSFKVMKHLIGAFCYHFWTKWLKT